ncbi:hypothetical protein PFLUV_G00163920 [Perca fluviatilis]|uniref:Uncharacterized protein n=1 Tax=Perca fluviatilis TaxID=8168 RepID=A0A6A5ENK3_PERFL|nr:hypothetical protein PFLUV_G00163920 [Perca fluviatilis]
MGGLSVRDTGANAGVKTVECLRLQLHTTACLHCEGAHFPLGLCVVNGSQMLINCSRKLLGLLTRIGMQWPTFEARPLPCAAKHTPESSSKLQRGFLSSILSLCYLPPWA